MKLSGPSLNIDPEVYGCLERFVLPDRLGFGSTMLPVMYKSVCENGEWVSRGVIPYGPIQLDPASKVLHYAQEVFEGMKAYRVSDGRPTLFRPEMNWSRINASARRMCMPEIPKKIFMEGLTTVTAFSEPFIPKGADQSLYLRPFMIGVDPNLMLGASNRHEFYVIASPSEVYHQGGMNVMIERRECRAAVGGTGHVKVGGNYAAALASAGRAKQLGYDQTLWLDSEERRYIEELSGMNIFAVIDGELHTPSLNGSILPGVTRNSIIKISEHLGYKVYERRIEIDELMIKLKDGQCSELFACGTAAVITPIMTIADSDNQPFELQDMKPVSEQLRQKLLDLQEGRCEDIFRWNFSIPDDAYFSTLRSDRSLRK